MALFTIDFSHLHYNVFQQRCEEMSGRSSKFVQYSSPWQVSLRAVSHVPRHEQRGRRQPTSWRAKRTGENESRHRRCCFLNTAPPQESRFWELASLECNYKNDLRGWFTRGEFQPVVRRSLEGHRLSWTCTLLTGRRVCLLAFVSSFITYLSSSTEVQWRHALHRRELHFWSENQIRY